jgi:hypothetical protein
MTTSDESERAPEKPGAEHMTARLLDLLEKLAAAESLAEAAASVGVSEDQARASLRHAVEIIRKTRPVPVKQRWPLLGSILDWKEMTVAEALEILAEQATNPDLPKADLSA